MIYPVRYYVYVLQRYDKGILSHGVNTHVLNYGPKGVRSPIDELPAESYTDQSKTPVLQTDYAQHKGDK